MIDGAVPDALGPQIRIEPPVEGDQTISGLARTGFVTATADADTLEPPDAVTGLPRHPASTRSR